MGATIQQKQQNATISSILTFHPNFTLSSNHISAYVENAVIFEVPSSGIPQNCSNYQMKRAPTNKNGSRNKIELTCSVRGSHRTYRKYIMKRINVTGQNQFNLSRSLEKVEQSVDGGGTHICKLVGYKKQYDGFMCGMHSGVSVVFQHWGDHTIAKELQLRAQQLVSKTKRIRNEDSLSEMLQYTFDLSQILHATKFLLETAKVLGTLNQPIPKITLSDVIFKEPYTTASTLKYRNPVDSLYCEHNQALPQQFDLRLSQSEEASIRLQVKMVENIGICIMSMCLLQDCYESCFNFIGEMCISVVEKKIEYIYELYSKKNNEKTSRQICKMLEAFILQNRTQAKINLTQAKSIYNKIYLALQQHRINQIQGSFLGHQFIQLWDQRKKICPREEETSASMESKTKKEDLCSASSDHHQNDSYSLRVSNDRINKLAPSRELSVKDKKDWKIDKSSERKIHINQTLKPRTKEWKIEQEENRQKTERIIHKDKTSATGCYEIDKKWSEDQELFKNMPEFQRFSSTVLSFHFNAHDLQPIQKPEKVGLALLK